MKKITQYITGLLLLLFIAGFTACEKTTLNTPAPSTIFLPAAAFLHNNYEFTLFYAAIQKAGLVDSLNAAGPFTIYAPDNNAFNLEGIHTAADFDKWSTDSLKFFIKFHILNRKLFTSDVPRAIDNLYQNADGINLYLSAPPNPYTTYLIVNGDSVSNRDLVMANGLVNELTRVLKYTPGTVQTYLAGNPDLSIFVAALKKADINLWDSLKTETANPYTIIAPNNEAYMKYNMTLDSVKIKSAPSLVNLVRPSIYYMHHVFYSDAAYLGSNLIISLPDSVSITPFEDAYNGLNENFSFGAGGKTIPVLGSYPYQTNPAAQFAVPWALNIDNISSNGIIDVINDVPALEFR